MDDQTSQIFGISRLYGVVCKLLSGGIEPVQRLIASDPKPPGSVFEQRVNEGASEAVWLLRIVNEYLKFVAVITVQAILCAKPHETTIILCDLGDPRLRKPVRCGNSRESNSFPFGYGQSSWQRVQLCLGQDAGCEIRKRREQCKN